MINLIVEMNQNIENKQKPQRGVTVIAPGNARGK